MDDREQRLRNRIDTLLEQRAKLREQLYTSRDDLRQARRRIATLTVQRDNWRARALRNGL